MNNRSVLLAAFAGWPAPVALLAQAAGGVSGAPLESPVTKIVVGVTIALLSMILGSILTVIFVEPIKAFLKQVGSFFGRLGWRFRKRYLEALAEKHRWPKLLGFYNSAGLHPPRLQEVYVSLRLAAGIRGKEGDGPLFDWHQIFQPEEKRLVILGSPGAGKSTLLDYLVLVFSGEVPHPIRGRLGDPCPLYSRLRELGTEGAGPLLQLLARAAPLEKVPANFPASWLERGRCLVLLDGLDEVLDEEHHARAVEEIERLVHEYPKNYYVITCRIAGWHNQLPGFRTYEVQPFTGDDVRRFIGIWYSEVLRKQHANRLGLRPTPDRLHAVEVEALAEAAAKTEELWQALSERTDLLLIATTPLLLSLVTLVHYHRQTDLPKGRAKLYEQCVEILLDFWDRQDKRLRVPGVPTLREKRMVLEAIAFHFLVKDRLEANLSDLRPVVEPLLSRIEVPVTAERLIRQIWERSGILQEQGLGRYGFAHRALHDFLAAAYVVEHERDDLLLDKTGEERWREVILIAAGLAPAARAERLVRSLLARAGDSGAELEMAGLTLAEDVPLGADLRAEVRRRLLDRLSQEEAEGPFRRLAGALMAADLDAACVWMEKELAGQELLRLRRILELLPGLGKKLGGEQPLHPSPQNEEDPTLSDLCEQLVLQLQGKLSGRIEGVYRLLAKRILESLPEPEAERLRQGPVTERGRLAGALEELLRSDPRTRQLTGVILTPPGEVTRRGAGHRKDSRVRILVLISQPDYTTPKGGRLPSLRTDEEVRLIRNALSRARLGRQFELVLIPAARAQDLSWGLLEYEPDILHFSGHYYQGEILVEGKDGSVRPIVGETLARLCAIFKGDRLRCVLLMACNSGFQAEPVAREVGAAVVWPSDVPSEAAHVFVEHFYSGLGFGQTLQEAFELGCWHIETEGAWGEGALPQLLGETREIRFAEE